MTNSLLLFGLHTVTALLEKQPERVKRLSIQESRQDKKVLALVELATQRGIPIEYHDKAALDAMTQSANHQGVLAFCAPSQVYAESDLPNLLSSLTQPAFILVLDGVQDPHNLGACFRSADAAGVHAILAPKDKSVGITPTVSKVASGATETIPFVQVTNLVRALETLKSLGIWIYGTDADASQTLYQTSLTGPLALVLGAEGAGMRRLTKEHCDVLIHIPMQGYVSSLNVSVAAGVCLFEVVRQRQA